MPADHQAAMFLSLGHFSIRESYLTLLFLVCPLFLVRSVIGPILLTINQEYLFGLEYHQ